jgi:hypothetical protein
VPEALEGPPLPVPDLEPRPITLDEYMELTPEKLELLSGYLIDEPDTPDPRLRLLSALMVNTGLVELVKMAPRERWLEALALAYGGPEER